MLGFCWYAMLLTPPRQTDCITITTLVVLWSYRETNPLCDTSFWLANLCQLYLYQCYTILHQGNAKTVPYWNNAYSIYSIAKYKGHWCDARILLPVKYWILLISIHLEPESQSKPDDSRSQIHFLPTQQKRRFN